MSERIAVVMAGGGGTRLWPASRPERPKQLLDPFLGSRQNSLLTATIDRLQGLVDPNDVFVVTTRDQAPGIARALPDLRPDRILAEPFGRNTAPCIALAVRHLQARLGERAASATVLVLPADHHVRDVSGLRAHLETACEHAEQTDTVVTLGITPDRPATGYGYIERDESPLRSGGTNQAVYRALRFVEKPDRQRARQFLETGRFLWNAGMFVMPLRRIAEELMRHAESTWKALEIVSSALEIGDPQAVDEATAEAYRRISPAPIDVAVMEKLEDLCVIPTRVGWTDLGSWQSVYEVLAKDDRGNAIATGPRAQTVTTESSNSLIWAEDGTVAVVGVENLAVVVSAGRVLVCPRDRAQQVRELVEQLRRAERDGPRRD